MHHLSVNKQCRLHSCPAPPYDIYAVTCNLMQTSMCCTVPFLHQHIENKTPDHKILIFDKYDEDTGRMEGQGQGAEERRELTGTSFQYQRVGHCQRGEGTGNRKKTGKWRTGAQESYYAYSGETRQRRERVVMTAIFWHDKTNLLTK